MITKMRRPTNTPYRITSKEGWRKLGWHDGIDYVNTNGDQRVFSVADGVVYAVFDKEYNHKLRFVTRKHWGGRWIAIKCNIHGTERLVYYMHMDVINVIEGQKVKFDDLLGIYGKTGFSSGDHIHYGLRSKDNKTIKMLTTNDTIKGLKASGLA